MDEYEKAMQYKLELDKQIQERHEKQRRQMLQRQQEEMRFERGMGNRGRSNLYGNDGKLDKNAQYKQELDKQMQELEEKRRRQKEKEQEEDLKLEMKIKRDREEINKRHSMEMEHEQRAEQTQYGDKDPLITNMKKKSNNQTSPSGIFGTDPDKSKLEKQRKLQEYQEELKRQAEDIKRKKMEEKQRELEEERKLEQKIQRELQDLENKFQHERELEKQADSEAPAEVAGVQIFHKPPPKKQALSQRTNEPESARLVFQEKVRENPQRTQPLSARRPQSGRQAVMAASVREEDRNRPSTAKKMYKELLDLKQDLLKNQEMIRKELALHKQQISEQIHGNQTQKTSALAQQDTEADVAEKQKEFEQEFMDKYHNVLSNEIQNLKKVLMEQSNKAVKSRRKSSRKPSLHSLSPSVAHSRPPSVMKRKQSITPLTTRTPSLRSGEFCMEKESKFIVPTTANTAVPDTPIMPRMDTALSTASYANGSTRPDTGFTEFGVDEYLIKESKEHNEYLQSAKKGDSRLHTPNVLRIDSLDTKPLYGSNSNMLERSIQSKSDFVYHALMDKQAMQKLGVGHHENENTNQDEEGDGGDMVSKLLAKNKSRLNYFRSTTPLNSTRSMKMGLQKIEDLLNEKHALNVNNSEFNDQHEHVDEEQLNVDNDLNSLYELL